jgi:hypothetical protein
MARVTLIPSLKGLLWLAKGLFPHTHSTKAPGETISFLTEEHEGSFSAITSCLLFNSKGAGGQQKSEVSR